MTYAVDLQQLEQQYAQYQAMGLNLDLTRGKPGADQVALSDALDGILDSDYKTLDGVDARNYGGLTGIEEARELFGALLGSPASETLVAGNSSLTLMYQALMFANHMGFGELGPNWQSETNTVKFLAPVPGYDRHFAVCEHFGIELVPLAMDDHGPLMDEAEALVRSDASIRGIWCVPRFSNPTGVTYSDEVVNRIAALAKYAGPNFRVFWDNAYAVHTLSDDAPALANIRDLAINHGTADSIYQFGSCSKITHAGAGIAFMAMSKANLNAFVHHLGYSQIGPDKVNQLRHCRFFPNLPSIEAHMAKHAEILKPRFELVQKKLAESLQDNEAQWTKPLGGYFVSLDVRPGLATEVVALAGAAGVKLTPAGATWPGGVDPVNTNIRIAPTFPSLEDLSKSMDVLVCCVKLATAREK